LLLGVLGGGVYWGVGLLQDQFGPKDYEAGSQGAQVQVTIPDGASGSVMAQALVDAGVVKTAEAFITAFEANKDAPSIQPGTYQLHEHMTAEAAVLALLDRANLVQNLVTIPEGFITLQIYQRFSVATGIPVADFQAAAADPVALGVPESWFTRSDGQQFPRSIEGFLFPASYDVAPGMTATQILTMMVSKFLSVVADLDFVDGITAARNTTIPSGSVTPYDALIVASIAQAEARHTEDMGKVARVIYNRIYSDLPGVADLGTKRVLQLDSAINYYFKIQGNDSLDPAAFRESEIHDLNNPYNTHDVPGLPRNPLGNPGLDALKAALNPPAGNWVFFVTVDSAGTTKFADRYRNSDPSHCSLVDEAIRNGVLSTRC
jgi:UPF0755 protein